MAITFPTTLDALPEPTSTTAMDATGFLHDVVHTDLALAIEAIEAKVGIDNSGVLSSLDWMTRKINPSFLGEFEDFDQSSITTTKFGQTVSGTGAVVTVGASDAARRGLANLQTGTTATGRASLNTGTSYMLLASGEVEFRCSLRIPTLSVSAQRYNLRIGIMDVTTGDAVDGAYFVYDDAASANWQTCTAANSVRTLVASSTVVAIATDYVLKIIVNAAGNSVGFYINGTLIQTTTTNIPGGGRNTGIGIKIEKTVGITNAVVEVDWLGWQWKDTLNRSAG